jgi:hypothetical protein
MKDTIIDKDGRRYYDPVVCLLMWAVALKGEPARALLKALGVQEAELCGMFDGREHELAAMRRLRTVGEVFGRELMGKLLIAKLAELVMRAESGRELEPLIRAAGRLPDWVFGEAEARPQSRAQAAGLSLSDIEALSPVGNGNGGDARMDDDIEDMPFDEAMAEVRQLLSEIDRLGQAEAEIKRHKEALERGEDYFAQFETDGEPAEASLNS